MPIGSAFGAGEGSYANQTSTLKQIFVSTVDTQEFTQSLQTLGLSTIRFVLNQGVGAVGATVVPQFCISSGGGDAQWFNLDVPQVIPPLTTVRLEYVIAARAVRLGFIRLAGQATQITTLICADS